MRVKTSMLANFFLVFSIFFYLNIIGFLSSFFMGSAHGDFEKVAAGNPVNQVSGLLLLIVAIILIYKSPQISYSTFFNHFSVFGLVIAFFICSVYWSEVPFISIRRIVAFSTLVLVCLVLSQLFSARSLLNLIYQLIVFTIILGFAWTLIQGKPISIGVGEQTLGMRGIFADKNGAARIYAYGLLLSFALGKYKTNMQLLSLFLILLALATSQSASAIILAFSGVGIIFLFRVMKGKVPQVNLLTLILAIAGLALSAYLASLLYDYLLVLLGRDPNLTNRAIIWELLTPYMEEKFFFGYGYGAFWASSAVEWFLDRWGFIGNAHSGYFEVFLHGGLALFILFLLIIFVFFRNAFALFIRRQTAGLESFYIALLVIQLVINYVAYILLNHSSFDMFLFTLIFFIVSYEYHNKPSDAQAERVEGLKG